MVEAKRYKHSSAKRWNNFLLKAKNATFLFQRDFMDYHQDRFDDASLMIYEGRKLVALFPANCSNITIYSHQGLSYGGLVLSQKVRIEQALSYFHALLTHYQKSGFKQLIYKQLPYYYQQAISFEDEYPLFLLKARLIAKEGSTVIDTQAPKTYQTRRKRRIKLAKKNQITVSLNSDLVGFWSILSTNLEERFGAKPVHSLEEITLLANRFPQHIQLYTAKQSEQLVAGILLFKTTTCVHAQYISANPLGKQTGALDLIVDTILDDHQASHRYFSLGISNERTNATINKGLKEWKEGFGGRDIPHNIYEIDIDNLGSLEGRFQ